MGNSELLTRASAIVDAALDRKAEDIVVLDLQKLSAFADTFIIATGSSDRNVRSIADAIAEAMAKRGEKPLGVEGYDEGRWVLLDLDDIIVHVFQHEVRSHYDLERLWSDAPEIDLGGVDARAAVPQ